MIENDRIQLRPIDFQDTENILKWRNSQAVKKYFCMQEDLTKEQHEWWLENRVKTGQTIQFIIHDKQNDLDLGTVYVRNIDVEHSNGEFGIYIGDSERRNAGIGSMAMELICNYMFEEKDMHKIYLRVLESNKRAISVYVKNGFQQEGVFKDHVYSKENGYQNVIFMAKINPKHLKKDEQLEECNRLVKKMRG